MSYLVLARKYRPKHFGEMVGQDHVVRALTNALDSQRLHHAYLFTGTRGVGKTTVARILAKSLNCLGADGNGGITSQPCGVCQACKDIDAGRFIDYTELDAASNRGIDDVQTLLEQAVYKPVQGRFKVFMIDEVHMLTTPAFNAMLKTLEEPPEYLKFVLATTDPQKVPVTVLSRCLQFNLRPMAPETVREHLTRVLDAESVNADAQSLRLLSRAARGSMRDALSLTDQAIAFGAGRLSEETVRQMLGSVDRSHVLRLIEALAQGDGKVVVETVDRLRVNGLSPASVLEEMSAVLQQMAVHQAVPDTVDDADPEATESARLATLMPADETQLLYSMCLHGGTELGLAPDEYAALTMVLLRLLAFKPASQRLFAQEKKTLNEGQTAASPPAPVHVSDPAPIAPDAVPQLDVSPVPETAAMKPAAQRVQTVSPASTERASALADAPQRQAPPGRRLSVVQGGPPSRNGMEPPPAADDQVVAVPVRIQSDARSDPLKPDHALPTLVPTEEGDFWFDTVGQLVEQQSVTALARELALQSQLVGRDTDQWVLKVEREALQQPGSRERLTAALQAAGHPVTLLVEIGRVTDSPARRWAAAAAERQLAAEQLIFDDPFVQTMMRDFGAKIVAGSIRPL
jgi:DNA polymerase-3 subunit gamma/tau